MAETVLITGGTGTVGHAVTRRLLADGHKVICFSRGEFAQLQMRERFGDSPGLSFVIGDVRDRGRLIETAAGATMLIHAAALKQIPVGEDNPYEVQHTNIMGTHNAIIAATTNRVPKLLFTSSDKGVRATTLYGATKFAAERLVTSAQKHARNLGRSSFAAVRYGNVLGSRGSVVWTWRRQLREHRPITITDPEMTRFWQTPAQAADLVLSCLAMMQGGEVFIPKHPAMKILDLADVVAPEAEKVIIGARTAAEKRHEELLQEGESSSVFSETEDLFVLHPNDAPNAQAEFRRYRSDVPARWVTHEEMRTWLAETIETNAEIAE